MRRMQNKRIREQSDRIADSLLDESSPNFTFPPTEPGSPERELIKNLWADSTNSTPLEDLKHIREEMGISGAFRNPLKDIPSPEEWAVGEIVEYDAVPVESYGVMTGVSDMEGGKFDGDPTIGIILNDELFSMPAKDAVDLARAIINAEQNLRLEADYVRSEDNCGPEERGDHSDGADKS